MDEIFYITNIDARPWKKSPDIGAAIPLVLFFASVETMRKSFNVSSELPNLEKYCVMIVVVVLGMYLSKRCALPWRKAYTTKLFLDLIYLCLISTGIYNALRQLGFVRDWLVSAQNNAIGLLDNRIVDGATLMHLLFAAITSGIGLIYIWARTCSERRGEVAKYGERRANHLFVHFQKREGGPLCLMYLLYFVCSAALISFLTIA
jgi:hypothetical protein